MIVCNSWIQSVYKCLESYITNSLHFLQVNRDSKTHTTKDPVPGSIWIPGYNYRNKSSQTCFGMISMTLLCFAFMNYSSLSRLSSNSMNGTAKSSYEKYFNMHQEPKISQELHPSDIGFFQKLVHGLIQL